MRLKFANDKIGCMCNGKKCYDQVFCEIVNLEYDPDDKNKDMLDIFEDQHYEMVVIEF